jgi:hypothetical protein
LGVQNLLLGIELKKIIINKNLGYFLSSLGTLMAFHGERAYV